MSPRDEGFGKRRPPRERTPTRRDLEEFKARRPARKRPRRDEEEVPREEQGGARGPARGPARGGRPAAERRPARDERPARQERPARPSRDERPARPSRDERPARPSRDERPARPSRFARDERPSRPVRGERSERPAASRGERSERPAASRGGRGEREERPTRSRFARDERPAPSRFARDERPVRPARPERDERPARPRADRDERPARPVRDERPSRSPRGDRPERGERPAARPASARDERPPRRDERPARRDERPARRDERPARRDERPARRDERPSRGARPVRGAPPAPASSRVIRDLEPMRVQRALARAGVLSRRKAEELVSSGRVTINGRVATIGQIIDPATDRILVDGNPVESSAADVWMVLHKPGGYLTSRGDPDGRPTVFDLVEDVPGLTYVGRLDFMTEGVLLLTTDGAAAHALTHPSTEIERTYVATVRGNAVAAARAARQGVELEDGVVVPVEATAEPLGTRRWAFTVTITEGRNREVRRLCEALGLEVDRLVRTKFGPVTLGELEPGKTRALTRRELDVIGALAGKG